MPRGAKPGERRGGRVKGTPNKATQEKAIVAERVMNETKMAGRKLAKEVLEDFMTLFAGMAAHHQPVRKGALVQEGREPNVALFDKYALMAVEAARHLAQYQSPKFSAVVVGEAGPVEITVRGGLPDLDAARGPPQIVDGTAQEIEESPATGGVVAPSALSGT